MTIEFPKLGGFLNFPKSNLIRVFHIRIVAETLQIEFVSGNFVFVFLKLGEAEVEVFVSDFDFVTSFLESLGAVKEH